MVEPILLVSYLALVVFQGLLLRGLGSASALAPPIQRSAAADGPNAALLNAHPPTPGALTGEPAPPFTITDVMGAPVDSATFAGQRRLLVFVAPSCPSCEAMCADLTALAAEEQATVVLVCVARAQPCRQFAERHDVGMPVLVDSDAALATRFAIAMTPTAVLIQANDIGGPYRHLGASNDPTHLLQQFLAQMSSMPRPTPDQQEAARR